MLNVFVARVPAPGVARLNRPAGLISCPLRATRPNPPHNVASQFVRYYKVVTQVAPPLPTAPGSASSAAKPSKPGVDPQAAPTTETSTSKAWAAIQQRIDAAKAASRITATAPDGGPLPFPLADGEVLLYESGPGTRKSMGIAFAASTGAAAMAAYSFALIQTLGFGSIFTRLYALFSVGVLVASIPFAAGTRNWVRYAVLTADGLHLRVYGSGPLRELFKLKPPRLKSVNIPIPLLSVREDISHKTGESFHVHVAGSGPVLMLDKPAILGMNEVVSSGLTFGADGNVSALLASAKALDPSGTADAKRAVAVTVTELANPRLLSDAQRARLRRFALLLHVLRGNPVNMAALEGSTWDLANIGQALRVPVEGHGHAGGNENKYEHLYWRPASASSGQTYWYNEITRESQFERPKHLTNS